MAEREDQAPVSLNAAAQIEPFSVGAFLQDETLGAVVSAMGRALKAEVVVTIYDGGIEGRASRTLSLVASGKTVLRLDAVLSANAENGIAGWRVTAP